MDEEERETINKKKVTERKRALRRNVRLKIKQGFFENLPKAVDMKKIVSYDDWR